LQPQTTNNTIQNEILGQVMLKSKQEKDASFVEGKILIRQNNKI